MDDGCKRWLEHHQKIAEKDPTYLSALNRGDVNAVAHALKKTGYYTASETKYAAAMRDEKAYIDRTVPQS
jgi:hypothetical protein